MNDLELMQLASGSLLLKGQYDICIVIVSWFCTCGMIMYIYGLPIEGECKALHMNGIFCVENCYSLKYMYTEGR